MLVLTRKHGEKIRIGDEITITVVEVGKSRVKLGIEAPRGHRILRSELVVEADPSGAEDGAAITPDFAFDGVHVSLGFSLL